MKADHIKIGVVWTILTSVVFILVYYFSGQLGQASITADMRKDIAIIQTQQSSQDGQITELKSNLGVMQDKLDSLLVHFGINYKK
jgi:hypothetical protein